MKNILLILLPVCFGLALSAQAPVILKIDTVAVDCNTPDTFSVPMRVRDFDAVGSFQFSVNWDTAYLKFINIAMINPLFTSGGSMIGFNTLPLQTNQGRFSVSWTSKFGGTSVPDDTPVFEIRFVRNGGPLAPVVFANVPSAIEVANPQGFEVPWDTIHGAVEPLDTLPPFVGCPANLTVQASGPTPVANIAPDSLSDNCEILNVGWTSTGATTSNQPNDPDASGSGFNPGVSTVTYTATDIVAQTATCTFNITVELVNANPVLQLGLNAGSCNEVVTIPVRATNFDSLYALSFSAAWNVAGLDFDSVGNLLPALMLDSANFNFTQTGTGALGFTWTTGDSLSGTTVPNGALLFNLYFRITGQPGDSIPVVFADAPIVRQALSSAALPPSAVPVTYLTGAVIVFDDVPPVLQCPPSITVDAPTGTFTATVTGLAPATLSDDCGGTPTLTYVQLGATNGSGSGPANGVYNAGATTVTYIATDSSDNVSTCQFVVVVTADLPLTFLLDTVTANCGDTLVQFDVTVQNFVDIIGANFSISWDETVLAFDTVFNDYPGLNLSPSDFLGFVTTPNGVLQFLSGNAVSGWPAIPNDSVLFSIRFRIAGPTNGMPIVFTPPIDAVNSAFASVPVTTVNGLFTLVGVDTLAPTLVCPANVTVNAPNGASTAVVNGLEPLQLTDDCSIPQLSYAQSGATTGTGTGPANGVYNAGLTTVVYTATDGSGQSSSCTFTVTVESTILTVLLDSIDINCDSAIQQISVNVTVRNFADVIGLQFSVQWDTSILQFDTVRNDYPGLNLTPSDFLGFASTPGGLLRFLAGNAVSGWPDIPNDSTLFTIVFNVLNPNAQTDLQFVAPFDAVDSTFNSVPLLTVNGLVRIVDTTPPVFNFCTQSFTVVTPAGECEAIIFVPQPVASDACSGLASLTPATTDTIYPVGNTVLTFTALDSAGNSALCSLTVTVTETVAPVILNCPDSVVLVLDAAACSAPATWTPPQVTDNCSIADVVVFASHMPGDTFSAGTTVVTYTAVDFSGNSAACTFAVILRDTVPPSTFCPQDITLPANGALGCAQVVFFGNPFSTDNCDTLLTTTSDFVSGDTFPAGVNVVTFTITDDSGNSISCSFNVTVTDSVAPFIACPSDILQPVDPALGCAAAVDFPPVQGFDDCDPNPTVIGNVAPGDTLPTGETTVTYVVQDGFGNTATCSFTITVADPNPPVLTCPDDIVQSVDSGLCVATINWNLPLVTDDCDTMPTLTSIYTPGEQFFVGATIVEYTAQDNSANISTCSFTILVTEDESPVFPDGCPADLLIELPQQGCDTALTLPVPATADNCSMPPDLFTNPPSGSVFGTGTTVVTYTLVDNAGNTATCTMNVTVLDQEPPVIPNCPPNLTVTLAAGDCDTILTWPLPVATDNCDTMVVVTSLPTPDTTFGPGNYTITVIATDNSGLQATCSFTIQVLSDQVPGFVNFPQDINLAISAGCDTVVTWEEPLLIGTCDTLSLTSNFAPGDTFPSGTTWVIYEGFDYNGAPIRDSFQVTILESSVPVFDSCPQIPVVITSAGGVIANPGGFITGLSTVLCESVEVDFAFPTASDNCDTVLVEQTAGPISGTELSPGTYSFAFNASDASGNRATCSIELQIIPLDAVDPVASPNPGCPEDPITISAPDIPGATYLWTGPAPSYPNESSITVVNAPGVYTLQISLDGCTSSADTVVVLLSLPPMAENDTIRVDIGELSDTFNVLINDLVGVGGVIVTVPSQIEGLTQVGNGEFVYQAGEAPVEISFLYTICSVVCPTLCDMATVKIIVNQSDCGEIPNIITPNGDDVNDYLVIPCLETGRFENNSLVIFNQWGDKVFEASPYSNDPTKAWRGELNGNAGQDLPDGTYYYVFNPGSNAKLVNGFVEIYR